jgi:hypothetical protein
MKHSKTKYIKLLKMFEENFKLYDSFFSGGDYLLNYTIVESFDSPTFELKIQVTMDKKALVLHSVLNPIPLNKVIRNYCNYFSIKENDIKIVRPLYPLRNKTINYIPIEERIVLECYNKLETCNDYYPV